MQKFLFYLVILLLVSMAISVRSCSRYRDEKVRLSDNQRSLMMDVEYYRTRDSLSAAGVERLTLSQREFEHYCLDLEEEVRKLRVKVKRLESVSRTTTETKYVVETVVRDSVRPGRVDTLKCVDYRNDYLTFSGCVEDKKFSGIIESRDTLIQVVHRVPRKFWFIRWGTKAIRQEVVCRNPYSRIVYTEYIGLKR